MVNVINHGLTCSRHSLILRSSIRYQSNQRCRDPGSCTIVSKGLKKVFNKHTISNTHRQQPKCCPNSIMHNHAGHQRNQDRPHKLSDVRDRREPIVLPRPLHQDPARQAPRDAPKNRRQEPEPRLRRAAARDGLEVQRDVEDRAHARPEAEKIAQVRGGERAVRNDALRREGFARDARVHFREREEQERDEARKEGEDGRAVCP